MRRSVHHLLKSLFKVGLLAVLVTTTGYSQLTFDAETLDMKAELADTGVTGVFSFTNTGETTVTITRVSSSCGCTVPELDQDVYQPGESGEIKAVFTFGSRRGAQRKNVTVFTDHPAQQQLTLRLQTTIPSWGQVNRRNLRWQLSPEGDYGPMEFIARPADPERIGVRFVDTVSTGPFKVEEVEQRPDGLVMRVTPEKGTQRATVRLRMEFYDKTGLIEKPNTVRVNCFVR